MANRRASKDWACPCSGLGGDLVTLGILLGEDFFFLELDSLLITSSPAVDFLFLADLLSCGDAP